LLKFDVINGKKFGIKLTRIHQLNFYFNDTAKELEY